MRNISKIVVGLLVALIATSANAAPLMTATVLGRIQGSGDPFTSTVVLPNAAVPVEYQLVFDMAPIGTTNTQGAITRTITALTPGTGALNDGVNSASQNIIQTTGVAGIQANLNAAMALTPGWELGTSASGGTPTIRSGSDNNLNGVRPARTAGLQSAIDPEVVATGVMQISTLGDGTSAIVRATWGSLSGGMKINNGSSILITTTTEAGANPFVGYVPLTISVPEPGTIGLLGLSLLGFAARRRRIA